MQPKLHREFLEGVYKKYIKTAENHPLDHYEQSILGYEVQIHNLCKTMPNKWNLILAIDSFYGIGIKDSLNNNYVIHFAGHYRWESVPYVNSINK
jgi:hypothetical protein